MASSTSTPVPSISRQAPSTPAFNQPSTPAQLFYGARGRSGSIASSFARQQAASRDQAHSPPPLPPLPASHSLPNNAHAHHAHSSSTSSFPRSSTFPSLSSPIRTTFPGSPVRSTFADALPPIRAGESFSIGEARSPSPSKSGSGFAPVQRNPSPLGHGNSLSLALPPATRSPNRNTSGTSTWSSASVHSITTTYHPPNATSNTTIHKHTASSSTTGEQIPLGRLPSKQSREALIPALSGGSGRNSGNNGKGGTSPSLGAMLFNAGKRASLGFGGGKEKDKDKDKDKAGEPDAREKTVSVVRASSDAPNLANEEREKEKGWGDSMGGVRSPRESIVKFTRIRSRSVSLESQPQGRSSGGESSHAQPQAKPTPTPLPHTHVVIDDPRQPQQRQSTATTDGRPGAFRPSDSTAFRGSESSHGLNPRRSQLQSGWQPDQGPVVKDEKTGRVVRQHQLIASESRWFCGGQLVTGGGTRRIPAKERKGHPYAAGLDDADGWAYSDGTSYAYDGPQTGSSHPIAGSGEEKAKKRSRVTLVPYPFVFSVLLVLGTAGTWIGTTCVWWWKHLSPAVAAIGAWLVLLVVVSMARTAFTDPGIVPRNLDLTPAMEDENTPYARDLYVRSIPVRVKYCMTCKTYRPLRSSHCRICDNCVDGCDHHCQWVNNCVGRRNYTSFITFLIACFLAIVLIAVTAALHIYLQTRPSYGDKSFHRALEGTGGGSAAVFVVCAAVVWPVGTLLGYHIRLLALNITTIEQLRNSAHAALAPGEETSGPGPNAFNLGRWTRNAAWGACRPAGMSWVEGWKPVRADRRVMLSPDVVV